MRVRHGRVSGPGGETEVPGVWDVVGEALLGGTWCMRLKRRRAKERERERERETSRPLSDGVMLFFPARYHTDVGVVEGFRMAGRTICHASRV